MTNGNGRVAKKRKINSMSISETGKNKTKKQGGNIMAKVQNFTAEIMQKVAAGEWKQAAETRENAMTSMVDNINKSIACYSYSDYNILADALEKVRARVLEVANTTAGK